MPNGRKKNVIEDELNIRCGGIYCVLPYDKIDGKGFSIFKVGMTAKSFNERIEHYHTYYPLGVLLIEFLKAPPVPAGKTKAQHYLVIERFVMDKIKELKGEQIHSTSRVKHLNVENKGETEFFFANEKIIHAAFKEAEKEFGGALDSYNLKEQDKKYNILKKTKPNFVAEIVYPLEKK